MFEKTGVSTVMFSGGSPPKLIPTVNLSICCHMDTNMESARPACSLKQC